jgi:hypothetical protein
LSLWSNFLCITLLQSCYLIIVNGRNIEKSTGKVYPVGLVAPGVTGTCTYRNLKINLVVLNLTQPLISTSSRLPLVARSTSYNNVRKE